MIKVKVEILHDAGNNTSHVLPVGWEPANQIEGAVFDGGVWWDAHEEVASLLLLESAHRYAVRDKVWVDIDKLRVKHDAHTHPVTLKARQQGL
jgi:hypothetical protein